MLVRRIGCFSAAVTVFIGAIAAAQPASDPYPGVNPLREDRAVWLQLLSDHASIRRRVVYTPVGVEATTESDDPAVAARIIDHAKAMKARIDTGARVRVWDPIFARLFERHDAVRLEVTPTATGVRIVESSDDPEVVSLLWSHASGLCDFVRLGGESAPHETVVIPRGSPVPAPEIAIGGQRHRFLPSQPDAGQLAVLKTTGVEGVLNFSKPSEHPGFDEGAAAKAAGLAYWNVPFKTADELTDAELDAARKVIREAEVAERALALHCRTGNRVGAVWAAYRVLDSGAPVSVAFTEAKAVGLAEPLLESRVREYIRTRTDAGAWSSVSPEAMTPVQSEQRRLAVEAKEAVFSRLFAALGEAMAVKQEDGSPAGPAGAIGVCKELAPEITRGVAAEKGVMIGRTSARLRNPTNSAPSWAAALFEASDARGPDGFPSARFAVNRDGSLGAALPIPTLSACVACHGPAESIGPRVREALAREYPGDRAVGFREGDLRGWFWVEVPPEAR